MNLKNLNNVGAARFKGDITLEGTGNLLSPYWYNVYLNGNIRTGSRTTRYPPTCEQYFSGTDIYNNSFDPASLFNNATFQNAHLNLSKGGFFLPLGKRHSRSKKLHA